VPSSSGASHPTTLREKQWQWLDVSAGNRTQHPPIQVRRLNIWASFLYVEVEGWGCTECAQLHGAESFEKPQGPQTLKKFPAFYGTRKFTTAFTTAHHLSLSWTRSIQSTPPSHFSNTNFNIILLSTPGPSKWPPSLRFPALNPCIHRSAPPYVLHTLPIPVFLSPERLYLRNKMKLKGGRRNAWIGGSTDEWFTDIWEE
jgi:hypothetical protein